MIYFTADNHFNHYNIIEYEKRPFSSMQEMNEEMIARWNNKVGNNDSIYILGDFAFYQPVPILEQLNGQKYLIMGNHDKYILNNQEACSKFIWIKDYFKLKINGMVIVLFHYPIMVWDQQQNGSFHFHGHVHSNLSDHSLININNLENTFNVGVDVNNYAPVSIDEIMLLMQRL